MADVTVVGGGLSGSEAAYQLAERGHKVTLYEMRPVKGTPAHQTDRLGEIVCSNTFKSEDPQNAHGLLKLEMDALGAGGSLLLACARESRIPGGTALTVDRIEFAERMTAAIEAHPRIRVVREESTELPAGPAIVATGPLTSDALSKSIRRALGDDEGLSFFDAIAPVVSDESLDHDVLFAANRWGKGDTADYLNAPMTKEQYETFVEALRTGEEYFTMRSYQEGDDLRRIHWPSVARTGVCVTAPQARAGGPGRAAGADNARGADTAAAAAARQQVVRQQALQQRQAVAAARQRAARQRVLQQQQVSGVARQAQLARNDGLQKQQAAGPRARQKVLQAQAARQQCPPDYARNVQGICKPRG